MNKPLFAQITDTHLRVGNQDFIEKLFDEFLEACIKAGIKTVYHLGDFFDTRKEQPEEVLVTAGRIFSKFDRCNINLIIIPGNHDKVNPLGTSSYLLEFQFHPNVTVISTPTYFQEDLYGIILLPYFEDSRNEIFLEQNKHLAQTSTNPVYVGAHCEVEGIIPEGKTIRFPLPIKLLKNFTKVFVGHYHNLSKIGTNIFYIGSSHQDYFSEDEEKGYTVVYQSGAHKQYSLTFPIWKEEIINLSEGTFTEDYVVDKYGAEMYHNATRVRLHFKGDRSLMSVVNIQRLKSLGFKIKTTIEGEGIIISETPKEETIKFDLQNSLKEFCEINQLEFDILEPYLND